MARYDRIARIEPPEREDAFPGWLTLRDLEGREREPELGRRARLRFLALRPVRRLLARGMDGPDRPDPESLQQQVDHVRRELDQLPSRDAERIRLTEYLREVGGHAPGALIDATLAVGEAAESAGHSFAAEEFFLTARELATAHDQTHHEMRALCSLGRVYRRREAWETAWEFLERAGSMAEAAGDLGAWAVAADGMAAVRLRAGDPEGARSLLMDIVRRGAAEGDSRASATGAAGLCALELTQGGTEAALEQGWRAIELMPPSDEERNRVLLNMAAAFRRLGLRDAAVSCYRIVSRWSSWTEMRVEAAVEHAVTAAEAGAADEFRQIRQPLVDVPPEDPQLRAMAGLGLGHGAILVGDIAHARSHLRDAISTARDAGIDAIRVRGEALLAGIERRTDAPADPPGSPPAAARRIAARIESLCADLATSA